MEHKDKKTKTKLDFIITYKTEVSEEFKDKFAARISEYNNVLLIFDTDNEIEITTIK